MRSEIRANKYWKIDTEKIRTLCEKEDNRIEHVKESCDETGKRKKLVRTISKLKNIHSMVKYRLEKRKNREKERAVE